MNAQRTTVDWLRFRAQAEPVEIVEALRPMFGPHRLLNEGLKLVPLERGLLGFRQAAALCFGDLQVGRLDYGGESQRGWVRVDLPGKGCEWVTDWEQVGAVEELPSAQIRRLDLALTTWRGEVGHQRVLDAHAAGRFITRGRPPNLRQIISSDPRAGKTCYIGEREKADKFMRCYEKGFEMAAKMVGPYGCQVEEIEGCPLKDIYRCEVELKAASRAIPWEVIERRDQYFAGAYPFCADVLPGVEGDILQGRAERAAQCELSVALENCRVQFGPTLFTALAAYQGDFLAVWDKIKGDHHCESLLAAGVLLVEHE